MEELSDSETLCGNSIDNFLLPQQSTVAQKSNKRLNVNADIPKTLTPKGYTKMQLMMSIAQKKYDNIVKRLKGTHKLYEDPDFPAVQTSIGNIPGLRGPVYWKRPKVRSS
ncbi:unnamed protein product [Schistocephalus solidus]|uniref:INO80 complex subunit C n=1 Tax=Schistocephalus solidus TaxID=70667 RepID=A0A183TIQ1_SCHSO|nr:unnamed protein product [Schistocephalus solidus]